MEQSLLHQLEIWGHYAQSRRVHPCTMTVLERNGDKAKFFTFGGTLKVEALPGETLYSLRSSAPVLMLSAERETAVD